MSFSIIDIDMIDGPFSTIDASFSTIDASFNIIDTSFNIVDASFVNLTIDFIDPDGNNVNVNNEVIIPHEVSYFHPDSTDVEIIESNGFKYIEIPYNIYFGSIRDEDMVVYDSVTEKRTVPIPGVIDFLDSDQLKQSVVISENGKNIVIVPRLILFEDEDGRDHSFR